MSAEGMATLGNSDAETGSIASASASLSLSSPYCASNEAKRCVATEDEGAAGAAAAEEDEEEDEVLVEVRDGCLTARSKKSEGRDEVFS